MKGWVIGGLGFALLATNLTTYIVLDRWCSDGDRTCEDGGRSRSDKARSLADLNRWSGILLGGVYLYGVIDGFKNYRRNPSVIVAPISIGEGTGLGVIGSF